MPEDRQRNAAAAGVASLARRDFGTGGNPGQVASPLEPDGRIDRQPMAVWIAVYDAVLRQLDRRKEDEPAGTPI